MPPRQLLGPQFSSSMRAQAASLTQAPRPMVLTWLQPLGTASCVSMISAPVFLWLGSRLIPSLPLAIQLACCCPLPACSDYIMVLPVL